MNKDSFIPKGYNTVIPALTFRGADAAIKWYVNVFNAKEKMRFENPDKTIVHAELIIGDSVIMLSEEDPEYNQSPKTLNGNSVNLHLYVPDVDATIKRAESNRARVIAPVKDQFYGDRTGAVRDLAGNEWWFATRKEEISSEELVRRSMEQRR